VEGFRQAATVAAEYGLTLGMEPLHREIYGTWTTVYTIPQTIALMDEIGEPNVQLLYDVYHLHDTEDVLADTVRHGGRISPSIHICDWRAETRNDFDRVLPGDGIIDLPGLFGALDAVAEPRWVDLEIFSDDGSFTDLDFEDSLWKQKPAEVLARAKAGFDEAWAARRAPA
jgi:sugar phosphate isomerase/epimerase